MARLTLKFLIAWYAGLVSAWCQAAPAPVEFFSLPQFSQVRISPSGEFVSALVAAGAKQRLWVMHADKNSARFLPVDAGIQSYLWASDERLLLTVAERGQAPGLAAVNRDGSGYALLVAPTRAGYSEGVRVLEPLPRQPAHVLISADYRLAHAPDIFRVNIFTGEQKLVARNPGRVFHWISDRSGQVRLAKSWRRDDLGVRYELRQWQNGSATELLHASYPGGPVFVPLQFGADSETLFAAASIGRDHAAIYAYDLEQRALGEPVFSAVDADVMHIGLTGDGGLGWVAFQDEKPQRRFITRSSAAEYKAISSQLPELEVRVVSHSRAGDKAVVFAFSDREPGRYYLYHAESHHIELIGARRPWLADDTLRPMQPVQFQTHDDLTLEGYLTLPARNGDETLPLIVYPHGGPWSRDVWGFDPAVQFFATHGYAVLQVNFRGSTGYGRKFLNAGRFEWGDAIIEDLRAGVAWVVDQGIADADRVCIVGSSFGGYAALMSAARFPEVYDCAVSFSAVTDLAAQIGRYKKLGDGRAFSEWVYMVGDPVTERDRLLDASPLHYATDFEVPLLLAHGARDRIVAMDQTANFVDALRAHERGFEYMHFEDADHGLSNPHNRIRFYTRALEFVRSATSAAEPAK